MSATAASLSCPVCTHSGVFDSVQSLRDRLIYISTNKILCPVCQEEILGLDKLTIHLFSHVKIVHNSKCGKTEDSANIQNKSQDKVDNHRSNFQQRKPKPVSKNKTASTAAAAPVKYVKIYPKLPVVTVNSLPIIEISQNQIEESIQATLSSTMKTEQAPVQTNTTCNICGLQFVDSDILRMHRCLIHNLEDSSNQSVTRYECHLCPKNFKMRGSLMVHLRVAHYGFLSGDCTSNIGVENGTGDQKSNEKNSEVIFERNENKQWQCDVCRKCFTTKYFLKKHKRLHTGETPYSCTQCNKTFTFQQSYHKHLLYHNDEKPHTCNYCGRAFKELSTLHNHQRIHTGEKPFSCESCGKCFRQRVSYLVHRRIHTGAMPYKCTACEKSFRYKVSQRTHKCPSKPPGMVIRKTGDLVAKLKKKNDISSEENEESKRSIFVNKTNQEISEANAELVRTGAKLSLEDMESENFKLIVDTGDAANKDFSSPYVHDECEPNSEASPSTETNLETLINDIPNIDNNIPSPSEILKNLCLSNDDVDISGLTEPTVEKDYDLYKDFEIFMG
ncbi:hypothetical protein ACJJTC_009816 [Scirpophaga incertulas]